MTPRSYPLLRAILNPLFSIEIGLSWEAGRQSLLDAASGESFRAAFDAELCAALTDEHTDWRELLYNSEYEVEEFETQAAARAFAISILWDPLHPGETPPSAQG